MSGIFVGTDAWRDSGVCSVTFAMVVDGHDDTFNYLTERNYTTDTLWEVGQALETWFNSGSRPWVGISGAVTVYTTDDPALGIQLTITGDTADITFDGAGNNWGTVTGWTAGNGKSSIESGSPHGAVGKATLSRWVSVSTEPGAVSQTGSWSMAGGGTATDIKAPQMAITFDEAQAAQFAGALREAGSPRIASVYDSINDTWRLVSLGTLRTRQRGLQHQTVTAVVRG